jgi:hypothetical protein
VDHRLVAAKIQDQPPGHGGYQQVPVGQEAEAERPAGHVRDDRDLAVEIDAEDLSRARI